MQLLMVGLGTSAVVKSVKLFVCYAHQTPSRLSRPWCNTPTSLNSDLPQSLTGSVVIRVPLYPQLCSIISESPNNATS